MSVVRQIDQSSSFATQTITSTTETIVVTGPRLLTPKDVWTCAIRWYLEQTAGTGQTSVVVRIRKGATLTGTILGQPQALTVVATNPTVLSGIMVDTGSQTDYTQYVVTVQYAGGAGNSSVFEAAMVCTLF